MSYPVSPNRESNLNDFGPHILFSCDQDGAILKVLTEGLGLEPGGLLFEYVAKESRGSILDFLLHLKRQGQASSEQINITTRTGPERLFLAGVALTDSLLIFGAPSVQGTAAWLAHMRAFPGFEKAV